MLILGEKHGRWLAGMPHLPSSTVTEMKCVPHVKHQHLIFMKLLLCKLVLPVKLNIAILKLAI